MKGVRTQKGGPMPAAAKKITPVRYNESVEMSERVAGASERLGLVSGLG